MSSSVPGKARELAKQLFDSHGVNAEMALKAQMYSTLKDIHYGRTIDTVESAKQKMVVEKAALRSLKHEDYKGGKNEGRPLSEEDILK